MRDITVSMARQTVISKKKRGPAPTGKGIPILTRLQPHQLAKLDAWAAAQDDRPSRPEALRRLASKALAQEHVTTAANAAKPAASKRRRP